MSESLYDKRLELALNMAAFILLAEAWVTYLPERYLHYLSILYYSWRLEYYLDYRWLVLVDTLGLAALHTIIWIVPYRILKILKPMKTIPYLYILSLGTVVLLYVDRNGFKVRDVTTEFGWEDVRLVVIYLLPTLIFHKYFTSRQKRLAQA